MAAVAKARPAMMAGSAAATCELIAGTLVQDRRTAAIGEAAEGVAIVARQLREDLDAAAAAPAFDCEPLMQLREEIGAAAVQAAQLCDSYGLSCELATALRSVGDRLSAIIARLVAG